MIKILTPEDLKMSVSRPTKSAVDSLTHYICQNLTTTIEQISATISRRVFTTEEVEQIKYEGKFGSPNQALKIAFILRNKDEQTIKNYIEILETDHDFLASIFKKVLKEKEVKYQLSVGTAVTSEHPGRKALDIPLKERMDMPHRRCYSAVSPRISESLADRWTSSEHNPFYNLRDDVQLNFKKVESKVPSDRRASIATQATTNLRSELDEEIKRLTLELEDCKGEISRLKEALDGKDKKLEAKEKTIEEKNNKINELEDRIAMDELENNFEKNQLKKENKKQESENTKLKNEIEKLLYERKSETEQHEVCEARLTNENNTLKTRCEDLEDEIKRLKKPKKIEHRGPQRNKQYQDRQTGRYSRQIPQQKKHQRH